MFQHICVSKTFQCSLRSAVKTLPLVVSKARGLVPVSPGEDYYEAASYLQSPQCQQTTEGPGLHCAYQIILQVPGEER